MSAFNPILCRKILGSYVKVTQTVFTELNINMELKQPRRRRQQKPHKFAQGLTKESAPQRDETESMNT